MGGAWVQFLIPGQALLLETSRGRTEGRSPRHAEAASFPKLSGTGQFGAVRLAYSQRAQRRAWQASHPQSTGTDSATGFQSRAGMPLLPELAPYQELPTRTPTHPLRPYLFCGVHNLDFFWWLDSNPSSAV